MYLFLFKLCYAINYTFSPYEMPSNDRRSLTTAIYKFNRAAYCQTLEMSTIPRTQNATNNKFKVSMRSNVTVFLNLSTTDLS